MIVRRYGRFHLLQSNVTTIKQFRSNIHDNTATIEILSDVIRLISLLEQGFEQAGTDGCSMGMIMNMIIVDHTNYQKLS